jgi:AcrR family transcriptional regulator
MKDQIIQIAMQQMKAGGYAKLNFADIAAELNVSRANLHHHFKNKIGLGLATTEVYLDNEKTEVEGVLAAHRGDISATLKGLEDIFIRELCESPKAAGCLMGQLIHDVEAPEVMRSLALERCKEEEESFYRHIILSQENNTLDHTIDAKALAFRLITTMFGISQMALTKPNKQELASQIRGALLSLIK